MTPLTPGRKIRIPRLLHVATDCLADVGRLLALGVDGLITDLPAAARTACGAGALALAA